jgi:hypothetical protein
MMVATFHFLLSSILPIFAGLHAAWEITLQSSNLVSLRRVALIDFVYNHGYQKRHIPLTGLSFNRNRNPRAGGQRRSEIIVRIGESRQLDCCSNPDLYQSMKRILLKLRGIANFMKDGMRSCSLLSTLI